MQRKGGVGIGITLNRGKRIINIPTIAQKSLKMIKPDNLPTLIWGYGR